MKVILFGATGMVGAGVLRECLRAEDVTEVVAIGRSPTGQHHAKLRDVVHADFSSWQERAADLAGADACFFCLGVSAGGMSEADYTRVTYDLTLAAARAVLAHSPGCRFCYVSGAGTDSSERGRAMWARVKGRTENELLRLSDRAVMFRPGLIRPAHGERSKTPAYRATYAVLGPFLGALHRLAPRYVTSTDEVGRAMLQVTRTGAPVRDGAPQRVLESVDIRALGAAHPSS